MTPQICLGKESDVGAPIWERREGYYLLSRSSEAWNLRKEKEQCLHQGGSGSCRVLLHPSCGQMPLTPHPSPPRPNLFPSDSRYSVRPSVWKIAGGFWGQCPLSRLGSQGLTCPETENWGTTCSPATKPLSTLDPSAAQLPQAPYRRNGSGEARTPAGARGFSWLPRWSVAAATTS